MQDKIVSSGDEPLILVDASDTEIGYLSKAECHNGEGLLHRAFSVFIFNANGELLMQQRGEHKRLWPGFWSNSCCSHPRKGESLQIATARRLDEELGIEVELEYVYKFSYRAIFDDDGAEHELCSVYVGRCNDEVRPNVTEIEAIRYITVAELECEMQQSANDFTPWFRQEWERLQGDYPAVLNRYVNSAT